VRPAIIVAALVWVVAAAAVGDTPIPNDITANLTLGPTSPNYTQDTVYILDGTVTVRNRAQLRVQSGVTITATKDAILYIGTPEEPGDANRGALVTEPNVAFTKASGVTRWAGIVFDGGAPQDEPPQSYLNGCSISGGSTSYNAISVRGYNNPIELTITGCRIFGGWYSAIDCSASSNPSILSCELQGTGVLGIACRSASSPSILGCHIYGWWSRDIGVYEGSQPTICSCLIEECGYYGILVHGGSAPLIQDSTIRNCAEKAVYSADQLSRPDLYRVIMETCGTGPYFININSALVDCAIDNNTSHVVYYWGGEMTENKTLPPIEGWTCRVASDLTIAGGATLAIRKGSTLALDDGATLRVGSDTSGSSQRGGLTAEGTPTHPIAIEGENARLIFNGGAPGDSRPPSVLRHVAMSGMTSVVAQGFYDPASLVFNSGSSTGSAPALGVYGEAAPSVTMWVFAGGATGCEVNVGAGVSPWFDQCTFAGAAVANVVVAGGEPLFTNCIAAGGAGYGVRATGGAPTVVYSDVWGNLYNWDGMGPGDGCFSADPLFVNAPAGNYRLAQGSPCIDTGEPGRTDRGTVSPIDVGALPYLYGEPVAAAAPAGFINEWRNWCAVPVIPDNPEASSVFGANLANNLFAWHPIRKTFILYPYDFTDVRLGESYYLLTHTDLNPVVEGCALRGEYGEVPVPLAGWLWFGHTFLSATPVEDCLIRNNTLGMTRTFGQDYDAGQNAWINWNFLYWDPYRETARICSPLSGDDTMLRPWYGYLLWSRTENLTFLIPRPE
jgi:hypothetical protein